MGIRLVGSHRTLEGWIRKLQTAMKTMPEISDSLAEESITLVSDGFRKGVDPYGGKWAARKSGGSGALLVDTGALRSSYHQTAGGAGGFTISSGVAYSDYHQDGTSRMSARRMVPGDDVPSRWRESYDEVVEEALDQALKE